MSIINKNDQSKKITQELYQKNVDLVHANNTLQLLQELYQSTIKNFKVELVAQQFIDSITTKLGFPDGLVALVDSTTNSLKIIAMTPSQVNEAVLSIGALEPSQLSIPLKFTNNALVKSLNSTSSFSAIGVAHIWTPLIKQADLSGVENILSKQINYIYPISIGEKRLGCFSVSLDDKVQELTKYQEQALNQISSVIAISIDRTSVYQQLQQAQARELDKAKEVIKLKDEFVFIATHDLRTPVTAFLGYLELLRRDKANLSPDTQENIDAIAEAGERLNQLVDDLLEVARSDSGTLKVDLIPINALEIIERSIRQIEIPAKEKSVTISSELDHAHPMILGDPDKFSEVMENLLSNAVKFNQQNGNIHIKTQVANNFLQFIVSDTGFGIPKKEQAKIFQKFFKYRGDETLSVPGTGLGLFVVKKLVEKMNGQITFTSEPNKGTTFTFTIPLAN